MPVTNSKEFRTGRFAVGGNHLKFSYLYLFSLPVFVLVSLTTTMRYNSFCYYKGVSYYSLDSNLPNFNYIFIYLKIVVNIIIKPILVNRIADLYSSFSYIFIKKIRNITLECIAMQNIFYYLYLLLWNMNI